MNVIFLDIDGVLNSSDSALAKIGLTVMSDSQRFALASLTTKLKNEHGDLPYGAKFALMTADPTCVGLFNRLLRETDAKIVLSSTHRSNFTRDADGGLGYGSVEHMHYLGVFLTAMGVEVGDRLIGLTIQYSGQFRGHEIQQYLDKHHEIDEYIILDDGKDFYGHQSKIWCDPHRGFSREEFVAGCFALGSKQSMIITLEEEN